MQNANILAAESNWQSQEGSPEKQLGLGLPQHKSQSSISPIVKLTYGLLRNHRTFCGSNPLGNFNGERDTLTQSNTDLVILGREKLFSDKWISAFQNDHIVDPNSLPIGPVEGTNDNDAESAAAHALQISDAIGPIAEQLGMLLASREARLAEGGAQ